jgi:hypothetical protein
MSLKNPTKKEIIKAFKQLLKTVSILIEITDGFLSNKFNIVDRMIFSKNNEDYFVVDISDCSFLLIDLIIYIRKLPDEYLETYINKSTNPSTLKDRLISFLSSNIACSDKYENVSYQTDSIYFTANDFFELLESYEKRLKNKLGGVS